MDDDIDDGYIDENNYEDDEYEESNESESIKSDNESEEDVDLNSEIYQYKTEKKVDVFKNKNKNIIIVPSEERITDNRLHKNELALVLSMRAKQIAMTATHFVKNCTAIDPIEIAYQELYSHMCPFKLRRQVGTNNKGDIIVEEWDIKTMVLPNISSVQS